MNKNLLLTLSCLLVLVFGVAVGVQAKDVKLSVMAVQNHVKEPEQELAKKFTEETGIKIDFQIVPTDQFYNLLITKLNAGKGPDIFIAQGGKLNIGPRYNVKKNCVDLTDEEWVKRMFPEPRNSLTMDGKTYGMMLWQRSVGRAFMYNKKIFRELDLKVPETYDEFKNVCQKIKEAGINPIFEPANDGWHHQLPLILLGPRYQELNEGLYKKLNNNEIKLVDVEAMHQALKQLKEMAESGYYGEYYMSNQYSELFRMMADGKFAMMFTLLNQPVSIIEKYPDKGLKAEDFGFFTMPFLDNQIQSVNPQGPSKFINKESDNVEAAKKYFSFLAKPENLEYILANESEFSALTFEGIRPEYPSNVKEYLNTVEKTGTVMQAEVKYIDPQWYDIGKDLKGYFLGTMTAKQVLQNMDKRRARMAEAQKDPAWQNE